jgi:L-alanine-DL-glutamate epimerase-like enolase superfamily enzyme
MTSSTVSPLKLSVDLERWPLVTPFRTAAHTLTSIDVIRVSLESEGCTGEGEGAGVYYRNDTPHTMRAQLESVRKGIEGGCSLESLQKLLPLGGARNALDCAMWDLRAKLSGRPAWQSAGIGPPRPLTTTFTCGADDPQKMAARALSYTDARAIKLKLTGEPLDAERVSAVRQALPNVWLAVDANQGFTPQTLDSLLPTLLDMQVELIEQPFPAGQDAALEHFKSTIPFAADESAQGLSDLSSLLGRYSVVNIKLDKCGGLTEALAMARKARELGLQAMVGNMLGTSLAMAPAYLVGQLCKVVDLDGPVYLSQDRVPRVQYSAGALTCPTMGWGYPRT